MLQHTDTDEALIRACRNGDGAAWERLLAKYERLVFSIPLSYGLSHDDAADITQLTFTILLQSLDTLREDSHLSAWLATIARRHTWRILTRTNRETSADALDVDAFAVHLPGSAPRDSVERWEMITWLHQGLAQLDARCRALVQALYLDERQPSYAEVAQQFSIPIGSIGPTRARCLERLKQVLDDR